MSPSSLSFMKFNFSQENRFPPEPRESLQINAILTDLDTVVDDSFLAFSVRGVDVDTVNNLGQTPLFCASLLSLAKVVDVLLQYGANPNHRCDDRSTPVHAAAFSCSPWILSALLDVGGDLRLHDREGRTARDWAEVAGPELSPRMLKFMQSCVTHMQSLTQQSPGEELKRTSGSSNSLIRSPSLLSLLKRGGSDLHLNRMLSSKPSASDTVHCFGFGKLCVGGRKQFGFLACVPVIGEKELVQADDEPSLSFHNGAFMSMTNFSWNGCRVTVKELQSHDALLPYSKRSFMDLLTAEQEYCSNLFHPHLLQLLAVCVSADLEQTRLVFERVHIGSLYSILHQRRAQFPVLRFEALLHLLLQVSDALLYLHCRGFIHRSLSSHAVQLVHPGVAKLTNLHFMVHRHQTRTHTGSFGISMKASCHSETDSEPQTMNKTFNISPRVQRSADPGKVEQSSGSDFMPDSSLEVSDEFFTPNPLLVSQEAALHSGRQALVQTPCSEEDLEVTVEVLWPRRDTEAGGSIGLSSGSEAGGSRAAVERPLDTEPNSAVVCASSPVTSFKAIGVSAEVPAEVEVRESKEVSLTDIQDLSSIACDGDSLSREVQQQGPVIRNTVALVSTPRSPAGGPGEEQHGAALVKKGVLGAESQGGGSSREAQDLLEETDRAHSTLDDVLQGMLADRAASENTQCTRGADRHAGLTESSELAERGGEASDSASPVTVDRVNEQDKKADSPRRAHWIQPHRYNKNTRYARGNCQLTVPDVTMAESMALPL
ncbi:UNVERIFIED_CONTAM: hypothetical protein FKN15_051716 [Acipenser sinensis]